MSRQHGDNVVNSTWVDIITQRPITNDLHYGEEVNTTALLATQFVANDYGIMDNTYIRKTWSRSCAKSMGDSGKLLLENTKHIEQTRAIIEGKIKHTIATKEVSSTIMWILCVPSIWTRVPILGYTIFLVLDVNGLFCQVVHLKSDKEWKPLIPPLWCGNKMVSPRPKYYQFLSLCFSWFDITFWSSTIRPNMFPMVELILGEGLDIQPIFVWGNETCEQTQIFNSLNPNRMLVFKKMNRVFSNISPRFKPLSINNTLLIDNCPFKCCCNAPGSYILPHPFNNEVDGSKLFTGNPMAAWIVLRLQPL